MGNQIGIELELRNGKNGEYKVVVYTYDAQKFIIDHLQDIFDYLTGKAQYIRDLEKGQKVIVTGYEGIDVIEATKVSYYY